MATQTATANTAWANAIRSAISPRREQPTWFDSEIDWYVNEREGDLGVRAIPVEPGVGSDPTTHDGISDHQVEAASRARRVDESISRMAWASRLLLLAVHLRISPHAHKDRHAAQAKLIAKRAADISEAVSQFRSGWRKC